MNKECCWNCKNFAELEQFKYLKTGGVHHENLEGFACLGFVAESRTVIQMCGSINPGDTYCEMFSAREANR